MKTASVKVGNRRLRRLAAFLRTLRPGEFYYYTWVYKSVKRRGRWCGTTCCAAGWLPKVFPRHWEWHYGYRIRLRDKEAAMRCGYEIPASLMMFFGLTRDEVYDLFAASHLKNPTAGTIARRIERFAEKRERHAARAA